MAADGSACGADGRPMFDLIRRRPLAAVAIALLGLAVRLGYVLGTAPRRLPFSDALSYQLESNILADGHGFVEPLLYAATGRSAPTAAHVPLYPLFLAAGSVLGARSVLAHQIMGCVLGMGTILGIGLIADHVAGRRAGLIAMFLAAVYPPLWVTDGGLMSEGLFAVLTAAIVVLSYRVAARPSPQRAAGLGLAIGLAMLTRDEAVLLLFVLVLPLVVTVRHRGGRQVALLVVSVVVATGATVSPWVIRNLVTFQRPVLMSTDDGTLHGANCPPTYYGAGIGTWSPTCPLPGPAAHGDESVQDEAARQAGLTYVGHHLSRLPVVVAARVGRLWEVYQPVRDADANGDDGRPQWANTACLWAYAALVPIAGVGLVLLVRRGQSVLPLVAQLAAVTLTAALVWGAVRFRVPADVVLVVFGGVALDAPGRFGVSHVRRRRSGCHERAASARARRLSSSSSGSDM